MLRLQFAPGINDELAEQSERMHQVSSVAQRRLRANYGWAGA